MMNDKIKDVLVNHMRGKKHHNEMELAFNEGFDKVRAFAVITHTSYNQDYVSPDVVRQQLDDDGDIIEHKHIKVAQKKPIDTNE